MNEYYKITQCLSTDGKLVEPTFPLTDMGVLEMLASGIATPLGHEDREDFDALARYVDTCPNTRGNREICWDEFFRLYENGHIPGEDLEELRVKMIKKFRWA